MNLFLGVDIGGTNIKILTVDGKGRVLRRGAIETRVADGPRPAFRRARTAALSLLGPADHIVAVGLGCAGLVDPRKRRLGASPNLPRWVGAPLGRIAETTFGVYTSVDNDANCAAWGEYRARRSKQHNLVFITLGTGVGGGVVVDGRLLRGAANYAGELGHMTISEDGPRCRCGNRGCLEAYVGTLGLVRSARALVTRKQTGVLARQVLKERRRLTPLLITEAARRRDASARAVVKQAGEHLGVAVASLVNIFNPEVVVLGGGVAASFDLLVPHIERTIRKRAFAESARLARIEKTILGNDATAVGAAMQAMDTRPESP